MHIQQNLESNTLVAFCKQVKSLRRIAQSKVKMWGRQVCMPLAYLLKGHAVWASGVSSYLFLCWDSIPWTKWARSLPPRKTACATIWRYKRKQLNKDGMGLLGFRFLQRRKDSKTWFKKRFWKFQNLLYLTQKWIYKIPKKDRYKKVKRRQDSNPRPTDCLPTLQPSELRG